MNPASLVELQNPDSDCDLGLRGDWGRDGADCALMVWSLMYGLTRCARADGACGDAAKDVELLVCATRWRCCGGRSRGRLRGSSLLRSVRVDPG
jgi:hypothetical protein